MSLDSIQTFADRTISDEIENGANASDEQQRLELSTRDSQAFAEALLNPPPPNKRLRETVARYRKIMGV